MRTDSFAETLNSLDDIQVTDDPLVPDDTKWLRTDAYNQGLPVILSLMSTPATLSADEGITLKGITHPEASLLVSPLTDDAASQAISHAAGDREILGTWDIRLVFADGSDAPYYSPLALGFDLAPYELPSDAELDVAHVKADYQIELLGGRIEEGSFVTLSKGISPFGLIAKMGAQPGPGPSPGPGPEPNPKPDPLPDPSDTGGSTTPAADPVSKVSPRAGDSSLILVCIATAALALGVMGWGFTRQRRRERQGHHHQGE